MKRTFTFLILVLSFFTASALDPAHFTVQRITAPYFVVDGNAPASGPLKAYTGFKITNTSASVTYTQLRFTITSIGTSVTGQNYSMVSPSTGITLAGTLAPGESKVCYYYVSYPAHTTAQATFNYTLSDATANSKSGSIVIINRSSISANAGGLATQSINNQDLIGGIVYDDVTYTLGNIRNGDEADFQVSVSTQFDPGKLVLLKTEVIASTVPGVATGTNDLLYYITSANQSSGTVTIRWTFRISSYNFTSLVLPYAGATSGASNYKYSISTDLGTGTPIAISSSANPLIITKSSDKITYGVNNSSIFTVTIQNPGAYGITIDKITDEVPAGFTYQSLHATSQVTASNSTSLPAAGATGTIQFEGGVVTGGSSSYSIAAGGSLVLKYVATTSSSQAWGLLTTARGYIGTTQFGSAQNTVNVSTTLPVTLLSFKGSMVNGMAKLEWITEAESNSSVYVIERSNDNTGFHKKGEVAARGYSTSRSRYTFTDSLPQQGTNLYRLKMIDNDGQFRYSAILALGHRTRDNVLTNVYPNPFYNNLQYTVSLESDQRISASLLDAAGRVILREDHNCQAGSTVISFKNLDGLPSGIYVLQVKTGNGIFTHKLMR